MEFKSLELNKVLHLSSKNPKVGSDVRILFSWNINLLALNQESGLNHYQLQSLLAGTLDTLASSETRFSTSPNGYCLTSHRFCASRISSAWNLF